MAWSGVKPSQFGRMLIRGVEVLHDKGEDELSKVLARRSPVLSGAFKLDWENNIVRSQGVTIIGNSMPYSLKLEAGASNVNAPYSKAWPKAPNGIAGVTVIEVSAHPYKYWVRR